MRSLLLSWTLASCWIWASIHAFSLVPRQQQQQHRLVLSQNSQPQQQQQQSSIQKRSFSLPSQQTVAPASSTSFSSLNAAAGLLDNSSNSSNNHNNNHHNQPSVFRSKALAFPRWMARKLHNIFSAHRLSLWKRRLLTAVCAVTLCCTTFFTALPPAHAAPTTNEAPVSTSLRPGMTNEQATLVNQGQLSRNDLQGQFDFGSTSTQQQQHQQTSPKNNKDDDSYDEFSDDVDLDDDMEEWDSISTSNSGPTTLAAPSAAMAAASGPSSSGFASNADRSARKQRMTQIQVGTLIFGPTFGGTMIREYVRRRREEAYVTKGLEIQKAQYAEYFNVTETTKDSDLEDELKGIKNKNETSTDDDEDEDDDEQDNSNDDDEEDDSDEDDDEPEPPRGSSSRGGPKRPSPPGDGGSSGGSDADPGYGKPSDEDLDRLNSMFNKS